MKRDTLQALREWALAYYADEVHIQGFRNKYEFTLPNYGEQFIREASKLKQFSDLSFVRTDNTVVVSFEGSTQNIHTHYNNHYDSTTMKVLFQGTNLVYDGLIEATAASSIHALEVHPMYQTYKKIQKNFSKYIGTFSKNQLTMPIFDNIQNKNIF